MSAPQFTPGPWTMNPIAAQVDAFDTGKPLPVCQLLWPTDERTEAQTEANARLIAAAPDYHEACGGLLDPGEAESCGPLAWLRSAIDTLDDATVAAAAEGDDPDAYQTMLIELRFLHDKLWAAYRKARGEA